MPDADATARHFDTDTIAAESREDAYLAEIDHALATVFLTKPFYARFTAQFVGPMRLIVLEASARRSERTPALIAHDRHDGLSIQLALDGGAVGRAGGHAIDSAPGTIMLLDFAQPFYLIDEAPRKVINLNIPRAMLADRVDDIGRLHGTILDRAASGMLAAQLRELPTTIPHLPPYAEPILCDVMVKLLLLALDCDPSKSTSLPATRRSVLFDRAAVLIDHRLGSTSLTPEWLIAKLNVSRSDLYAAFDSVGGISRFIWRRRLEAAHAALQDASDLRRIGEIAFAVGFSSEAHFARAFRNAFGSSASDIRRARVLI